MADTALNERLARLLDEVEGASEATPAAEGAGMSAGIASDASPRGAPLTNAEPASAADSAGASARDSARTPGGAPAASGAATGGASPAAALSGLFSNPALLAAIPTLLENLSPLLEGKAMAGQGTSADRSAPAGKAPPAPTGRKYPPDRHTALLCAIKPYLGPERQAAAETILHLCRIWDALARSGISVPGLLSSLGGGAPSDRKEAP